MCVFKNHAFIYFLRPPSWSGTPSTGKIQIYRKNPPQRILSWPLPSKAGTYNTQLAGFYEDDMSPWVLSSIHIQRSTSNILGWIIQVLACHNRRFVGWTDSVGKNVAWSVHGEKDRHGTVYSILIEQLRHVYLLQLWCTIPGSRPQSSNS